MRASVFESESVCVGVCVSERESKYARVNVRASVHV